jgi:hypothetical protein
LHFNKILKGVACSLKFQKYHSKPYLVVSLSLCGTGVWTQSLTLARQALYHFEAHLQSSDFLFFFFAAEHILTGREGVADHLEAMGHICLTYPDFRKFLW